MLIRSAQFYERVLHGLYDSDPDTVEAAISCLSWFAFHMRKRQLSLPAEVEAAYKQLPEV